MKKFCTLLLILLSFSFNACKAGSKDGSNPFDPDFVIAESQGVKIANKDLNPRFLEYIQRTQKEIARQQIQQAKAALDQKTNGQSNRKNTKLYLDDPRVEVQVFADDPQRGNTDAAVTLIEFSDYRCGYCARLNPTLLRIYDEYNGKVRHVFKDFPIFAPKSSEAAHCAHEQGAEKFWQFQKKLFSDSKNQEESDLKKYAKDLGLDSAKFDKCLAEGKYSQKVQRNFSQGKKAGVSGTPAMVINGVFLSGAQPYEKIKAIIDAELEK